MRKYIISQEVLAVTIGYLESRPNCEVKNIVLALENSAEYENYKAKEAEERKLEEERKYEIEEKARKKIIDEYLAGQKKIEEEVV